MGVFDDDLTDADMAFLERFNKLGRSDTADSEYNPSQDELPEPQGEADHPDAEGEVEGEFEGQPDGEPEGEGDDESGESEQVDQTKMDISDIEPQDQEQDTHIDTESSDQADEKDHLESGETESEIEDGESDLDYDDLDYEGDEDEADDDLAGEDLDGHVDDDKMAESDELPDPELHNSEEPRVEFDDETQVEEDDGEGERGNSDEARESDEPIGGGDDSEEDPDDKGMTEDEADEIIKQELDPVQETIDQLRNQELNAEGESDFEGDAQQELEDHLKNSKEEDNTEGDDESEEVKDDDQQEQHQGQGDGNGKFSDMPEGVDGCDNHCEDNEQDEGDHECPRCAERTMRERKLWGEIATDMHGNSILPGDKLRVEIPMSFFTEGTILTANVPNSEMDRIAIKTNGTPDPDACWLSGRRISQFTGYHLKDHGPVWTFTKGRRLRFAEKVGEPMREGGGQGDIEDMIEQLKEDLDQGKFDEGIDLDEHKDEDENEFKEEQEPEIEEEPEPEEEENQNGDLDDLEQKLEGTLTKTQLKRFENLFERLEKKIEQTFGSTAEVIERGEIVVHEGKVARPVTIRSRGVQYSVVLVASREAS